jgi:hypothetical protein
VQLGYSIYVNLKTNRMAKVTKERLANICKRVNEGMKPSYAARAEGLGGEYLIALKESGILYKDEEGNWKGKVKIHSSRYDTFILYRQKYSQAIDRGRYTTKHPEETVVKVGFFKRIWNRIVG